MIEIGRVCVKTAGRDAGNHCVIVEVLKNNYVMIDGNVRRRKCNVIHLEPIDQIIKIKEKATTKDVKAAMKKEGLEVKEKKKRTKTKEKTTKPIKKRAMTNKPKKEEKPAKKEKKDKK